MDTGNSTRKNPPRSANRLNTQSSKDQSYTDMQTTDNESAGPRPYFSEDESDCDSSSRQQEKLTREKREEGLGKKKMSDKVKELERSLDEERKNNTNTKEEKAQLEIELKEVKQKQKETEDKNTQLENDLKEVKQKQKETEDKNTQLENDLTEVKKKQKEPEDKNTKLENDLKEVKKKEKETEEEKLRLEKNIHYFIWIASVLVLVPLCIGLHWAFKGHETNHHELRLMLVGKIGAGKSASGNTILGEEVFRVEASPASVTASCIKKNKDLDGRNITIIDTPGVMDTWLISNQMADHAHECMSMSSPDPHVFLLVIRLGRFTVEESNAVKWIQENFGEVALKFTIILFTGGDLLEGKAVEEFISNSIDLQNLVDTCEGRYHVFNNYKQSNRTQVTELFKKINAMLHQNMGYFYMKEVHQKVQQSTREEEEAKRVILEKEIQTVEMNNRAMMEELIRDQELKRKELKENMTVEVRRKINEMAAKLREEEEAKRVILEKKIQTVEVKNRDMMDELIRDHDLKKKQLKENMEVEERRKMNEMAVKLRDEQYENKHLKAELEHA